MKKAVSFLVLVFLFMHPLTAQAGEWKQDTIGWWYQNDDGSYKIGWYQDADEKWYYFDEQSGYMLSNTTTPDGYIVGSDGMWLEGKAMNANYENGYEKNAELKITAFKYPGGIDTLKNEVTVKVHYNETYDNIYAGKIQISGFEVSKDGVAYIKFNMDRPGMGMLNVRCRYYLEDGSYEDINWKLFGDFEKAGDAISTKLFKLYRTSLTSAEVWIDKAEPQK